MFILGWAVLFCARKNGIFWHYYLCVMLVYTSIQSIDDLPKGDILRNGEGSIIYWILA